MCLESILVRVRAGRVVVVDVLENQPLKEYLYAQDLISI